ncbi:amidase [Mycolicibacillus trivialis]
MRHVHAFGDDALGELDAVGLAAAIRSGDVTRAAAVEAAIARLAAVDPVLNGLAHEGFEAARRRAREPAGDGFFAGVPTLVKDNVDAAGLPTMQGTDAWRPSPAAADGATTALLRALGLNPLGKSQLSEFGFSAAAEHPRLGAVRNPWDTDHTAGASSSGSAAFVAAGVVPIAHANDGGGSIRIPASCNGLVGLKPSRGRLPLDRDFVQMPVRIVYNGVVTRTVRDTAAFYREAERRHRNRRLAPVGDVTGPAARRLTVVVVTRSIGREASAEVRELTLGTAALLADLGHRVEYLEDPPVPASFADDFLLYWAALATALVRSGKQRFGPTFDRTKLDNLTRGLDRYAIRRLHRLPLAAARLAASRRRSARFFRDYDVLLTPTVAAGTPPVGHFDPTADYQQIIDRLMDWVAFTPLQNATGDPSISLPLTVTAAGLPLGMLFSAARGDEATLLGLAYELEEARPWARIQD